MINENIEKMHFFDEKGSWCALGLVILVACVYYQGKSSSGVCDGDASLFLLLLLGIQGMLYIFLSGF